MGLPKESIYTAFSRVFTTRVKLYSKKIALEKQINEKIKEQQVLKTILQQEDKLPLKEFSFSLSKGPDTYFEILEISRNNKNEEDSGLVYKARRVYQSYKDSTKMTYLCEIKKTEYFITAEDGVQWKGQDVWKEFSENFKNTIEFKNIEHFFGLTYKPVQTRLEKINETKQKR
ncbi:uncharacterized protein VNE69_12075 [Vairimorpha necatrix]|uniref:NADH dehydrogenase subunit 9 n=1 Tax=Vairimorpha necatrix TaxID=6039 RepID=A0AAX4JGL6_9MICR